MTDRNIMILIAIVLVGVMIYAIYSMQQSAKEDRLLMMQMQQQQQEGPQGPWWASLIPGVINLFKKDNKDTETT